MGILTIIGCVAAGVLIGWLIDRRHTKAGNTADTNREPGGTSEADKD